jgi:hypothetical protein
MNEPKNTIPHQLNSWQVLFRFAFRIVLLSTFATFSTQGFRAAFVALLALSSIFCAVAGALRQEAILGRVLTHWDEAAAYAFISRLISAFA